MSNCALVTCYYHLSKSKHSHAEYVGWIRNFSHVKVPKVIFVGDQDTYDFIASLSMQDVIVIILPFKQLLMSKYMDKWKDHYERLDPEKDIHNPNLYIIWNEKIEFLRLARDEYMPGKTWYMWMDIGSFRCEDKGLEIEGWAPYDILNQRLSKDKINLLQVGVFQPHEYKLDSNQMPSLSLTTKWASIGGTFVIPSTVLDLWHSRFYALIDKYFEHQRFAGKDQTLLAHLMMLHPDEVHVFCTAKGIACSGPYDPWFYFHRVLHPTSPKPFWVTVLIPLYNKHNDISYLNECLQSVVAQSYSMWNVIIGVNGVSKPEAQHSMYMNIVESIVNMQGHHVRHKIMVMWYDTKGKPATMNAMVADATMKHVDFDYDYRIAVLDVDDMWHPDKLAMQIGARDYDVVGTACKYFGESDGIPRIPYGDVTFHDFLAVNPMINSSVLIRPVDAMWTSDYELDDYDMWMRLRYIKHRTFYNIPGVLTYHRIRKSSAFNASGVQDIDGFKKAWIRRIEELKNQRKKG